MILKGSQRGGAKQLARHLLNDRDNDHVTVHSIDGFISNDIEGALTEIYAISRATRRCKQFMFSLSLSPPRNSNVTIKDFEDAIEQAGEKLGLSEQPKIVIIHEKKGRKHCHVVFSRIDTNKMKAINMAFHKDKLNSLARELFLCHGWELPKGFKDRSMSNPLNFSLEEYQVAKRAGRDPKEIKATFKQCWQRSDDKQSFINSLEEKGFYLCRGSRRGFVALDWLGNVYSLSRWTGAKSKALKSKLGVPEQLLSVKKMQTNINIMMSKKHAEFYKHVLSEYLGKKSILNNQRNRIILRQRNEREKLHKQQQSRLWQEAINRSTKFRKGLLGLWDWVIGDRRKMVKLHVAEIDRNKSRDQLEFQVLTEHQNIEKMPINAKIERVEQRHKSTLAGLNTEFQKWQEYFTTSHEKFLDVEHQRDQHLDMELN